MPDTRFFTSIQAANEKALAKQDEALTRIETKVSAVDSRLTEHLIANSGVTAEVKRDINGLGTRLNEHITEHRERRKWTLGLWAGMILALAKAAWDLVAAKIGGK